MTSILRATASDYQKIVAIGRQSFLEAHPDCAPQEILDEYLNQKFNAETITEELNDVSNIFHIIYHDKQAIGYSKIILNYTHINIDFEQVTKLERLYLLKEFYSLKLGFELFNFNIEFSKNEQQKGMWLFVWDKNEKAISFYKKVGFKIIGNHNFFLSKDYSNPNHHLLLTY